MTKNDMCLEEYFLMRVYNGEFPVRSGRFYNAFQRWLREVKVDSKGRLKEAKGK